MTAAERQPAQVAEISVGQEAVVVGPLDANTVADVRTALHDILDRGEGDLLVHLAKAEVYDATGLGVIVGVHHRAQRVERRLVLADVSPRLDRLLRASRLHLILARGTAEGARTGLAAAAVPDSAMPATGSPTPANAGSGADSVVFFTD